MAVSPLNIHVRMVNEQGQPTPEFMRWWQEFLSAVRPLSTSVGVSDLIDVLGATRGSILIRGETGWALLTPGTSGKALVTQGAGADPIWSALTSTFVSLSDTPSSLTGSGLMGVRVNAAETALEFYTVPTSVTAFLGLSDTPASYSGQSGKVVAVNGAENGLEFVAGGGGGSTGPLGFAKFTKPGDTFTAVNSGSPTENAYVAAHDTWRISHTNTLGVSFALQAGLASDGVVIFRTHQKWITPNFHALGVAYGESSSGRRSAYALSFGNTFRKQLWNGTSFVSESTVSLNFDPDDIGLKPIYWRFTRAGTAITVDMSFDGLTWVAFSSGTTTENGMSDVDRVGIYLNSAVNGGVHYIECFGYDTSQQDEAGT